MLGHNELLRPLAQLYSISMNFAHHFDTSGTIGSLQIEDIRIILDQNVQMGKDFVTLRLIQRDSWGALILVAF